MPSYAPPPHGQFGGGDSWGPKGPDIQTGSVLLDPCELLDESNPELLLEPVELLLSVELLPLGEEEELVHTEHSSGPKNGPCQ